MERTQMNETNDWWKSSDDKIIQLSDFAEIEYLDLYINVNSCDRVYILSCCSFQSKHLPTFTCFGNALFIASF